MIKSIDNLLEKRNISFDIFEAVQYLNEFSLFLDGVSDPSEACQHPK